MAAEKPNVVLVMTDDQGYGDLACNRNPIVKTPNLDRLHDMSVRMTDFHVSPFCTPTRAALMAGRYAAATGAYRTASGRTHIHPREVAMPKIFADNGYRTGMFGKWHLGDNYPSRPMDKGFQHAVWHRCGGVTQISDYWGNDYFDDTYLVNDQWKKFEGYCTDIWFREALKFIKANKDRPFFVYIPTNAPHGPYFVADKYQKMYEALGEEGANTAFKGMITNIDENMGVLMQALADLGLEDNTILIFMTDNGSARGAVYENGLASLRNWPLRGFNGGMRGKKSSPYDGGHRVPFFIRWPNGNLGGSRDIDTLTAHIDVVPTLMELCGLDRKSGPELHGRSMVPLLRETKPAWPERTLFSQIHGGAGYVAPDDKWLGSAVMTERWRLVDGEKLYDIQQDPGQRTDLASEQPAVVRQLREEHDRWYARISPNMKPTRIVVGNDAENPSDITSEDWVMPSGGTVWAHGHVVNRNLMNGPWHLRIDRAGKYRIILSRWPRYIDKPIDSTAARIKIGSIEQSSEIGDPASQTEISFDVDLEAGPTELQTWLTTPEGKTHGAYFVTIERTSD